MNISDITKQIIKRGISKLNRFQLEIVEPPRLSNNDNFIKYGVSSFINDLNFQCESVNIPSTNIETNEDLFITPVKKSFSELKVTIRVGADMKEKKFFDAWCNNIINENSFVVSYLDNIKTSINIYKMNDDLTKKIYGVQLIDAYPKTVGEVTLSQDSSEYMTIDVNFVYRKTKILEV